MRNLVQWIIDLLLLRHLMRLVAYLRRPDKAREEGAESAMLDEVANLTEQQVRRAKFRRRIRTSLLIGIVIEVMLIAGHRLHLPILVATEDAAMDFVMRQFRNVKWPDEHTAFVLLEADQASFEMRGEPFYFHRDNIQELIEFASGYNPYSESKSQTGGAASPALIIVDVDLSKRGLLDGTEGLMAYLKQYSTVQNPPLILARTFKYWPAEEPGDTLPRERTSFLDQVVEDKKNQNIFWASPHFLSDDDYRIRRWLLWSQTRIDAKPSVLPSIQLLAQALLTEDNESAKERYEGLKAKIEDAIKYCDSGMRETPDMEIRGRHEIDLCPSLTAQRLIYAIPYEMREGARRPKVIASGGSVPILERESAMRLAKLDRGFLDGAVVVIGSTYRESRDWYATPIGEMPGAMVVINAIHSLGANGTLEPPHWVLRLTIVVVLVLMMSMVFARLSSFISYLVASALVLILLVPFSFLMFRSGVWVDFALPLLAVQLHEFAAEFESIDVRSRKRARKKAEAAQVAPDTAPESAKAATTNDGDAAVSVRET